MSLGSGIKLSEEKQIDDQTVNWDLVIDNTGDISAEFGVDELAKDLAFQTASQLDAYLGAPLDETFKGRIRVKAKNIILQDPRIDSVPQLSVESDDDTITLEVTALVENGDEYTFVVPVGE